MNRPLLLAMALVAIHASAATPAQELPAEARADLDRATRLAVHAEWAAMLRRAAFRSDGEPIHKTSFFSAGASLDWGKSIASELDVLQLGDFFLGAQVWFGPFNDSGAVLGFYNPFWDALAVVRTEGAKMPLSETASPVAPKISRFAWASGETLRGEPPSPSPSFATVIPGEDPLSPAVWRVQVGSLAAFDALCAGSPEDQPGAFRWNALPDPAGQAMAAEWERIQVRSAARLRQITLLAGNRIDQAIADRCRTLLRSGSRARLRAHFTSPVHSFFVDSFAHLPGPNDGNADLRGDFEIYGYVPAEAGTLYVFANAEAPRLYATVSFPRDRENNPDAGDAVFEWYDLEKAPGLLAAWREEHPAAAEPSVP